MNSAIRWGVILGVAVAVLNLVFGFLGWHRSLAMAFAFLIVAILLNVAVVVLCLRESASSEAWLGQLKNGLVLGIVASVLVFAGSWVTTSLVFPDYFAEMAEGYRQAYVDMGLSADEVEELVAGTAATTSVSSAFSGMLGTFVTSVLVAGIAGFWLRKKD